MDKKPSQYIKIPTYGVIFYSLLLAVAFFYSGYSFFKSRTGGQPNIANTSGQVFAANKSSKPELSFYVMSFCPYGNQMEDVLRPVFDLLGNKANITPHYIFDKIDDLGTYCKSRSGDPAQCATYVQNKYFTSETECKKVISENLAKCQDDKAYIKSPSGAMYASLHGRQEGNQNIREMCAWNMSDDKKQWWDFVGNVNKNCTQDNADVCWEQQAKDAGFDTSKIAECFNKDGIALIEKEIELTTKFQVSGSPTVLVNEVAFPPEAAYTQDGTGTLKIGDKVATQDKYRTPNVIKAAVCASFKNQPKECKTILNDLSGVAPSAGGC